MQRDVEIEIETTDKSGGFIGALYLNKNENAAVTLVSEGLATVHSFSADSLPWSKQLYDAEVRRQAFFFQVSFLTYRTGRGKKSTAECMLTTYVALAN
jgi:endonuclease YncB( thermonuclease family)